MKRTSRLICLLAGTLFLSHSPVFSQAATNMPAGGGSTAPQQPTQTPNVPSTTNVPTSVLNSIATQPTVNNSGNVTINVADLQNPGVLSYGTSNFSNTGSLVLYSTNPNVTTATISANNIVNGVGASIATVSNLAGFTNLVPLSLSLVATSNIVNMGRIESVANLNMTAGAAIYNSLPQSSVATVPAISALGNININTGSLFNNGVISSTLSNINITALSNNLIINNISGRLEANTINILNSMGGNIDILGGSWVCKQALNIDGTSGGGLTLDVEDIVGTLNIAGLCDASIKSAGPLLTIGKLDLAGDPIITSDGDIDLDQVPNLRGEHSLSIRSNNGSITASSATEIVRTGLDIKTGIAAYVNFYAGKDIRLNSVNKIEAPGFISLFAAEGSVIAPLANIYSKSTTPAPGSTLGSNIPYTVFLYAHNNVSAGDIKAPGGYVLVRAGGVTQGELGLPGTNPGSINVGKVNIVHPELNQGQIYMDNFGGPISTGMLKGNGSDIILRNGADAITVNGGILNTSRTNGGNIIVVGGNISINGQVLNNAPVSNNGATGSGGFIQLHTNNLAVSEGVNNNAAVDGGSVEIITGMAQLTLGSDLIVSNTAGRDGGKLLVENVGGPLTLNSGGILIHSQHHGAQVTLEVGATPSGDKSVGGLLTVNAPIDVAGHGDGSGGTIWLFSNNVAENGGVLVNGNLNVNSGPTGAAAGSITINGSNAATRSAGVKINGNLTANSATGAGGSIAIDAPAINSVVINSGNISANGGTGGGIVTVNSNGGLFLNGSSINANGTGAVASGGTISITDVCNY